MLQFEVDYPVPVKVHDPEVVRLAIEAIRKTEKSLPSTNLHFLAVVNGTRLVCEYSYIKLL